MKTVPVKNLRVVRMTNRMLVFSDNNGKEFYASKRVANEILSECVEEAVLIDRNFFKDGVRFPMMLLATPSCW